MPLSPRDRKHSGVIVLNKPFAPVLGALKERRLEAPARRVLIYVEPSPIAIDPQYEKPEAPDALGTVAAGEPIEAVEDRDSIAVPEAMLPATGPNYVLRVRGDSMIDEQIRDGDFVIVEDRKTADNGEMVIALIVNSEGFPFSYETFDGNRADVSPVETILRMVERKYGKARRIWGVRSRDCK